MSPIVQFLSETCAQISTQFLDILTDVTEGTIPLWPVQQIGTQSVDMFIDLTNGTTSFRNQYPKVALDQLECLLMAPRAQIVSDTNAPNWQRIDCPVKYLSGLQTFGEKYLAKVKKCWERNPIYNRRVSKCFINTIY